MQVSQMEQTVLEDYEELPQMELLFTTGAVQTQTIFVKQNLMGL